MFKGFKDFIIRGNVIDLVVSAVIGSAFTTIVTAFTDSLFEPLLNTIGSTKVKSLCFEIINGNPSTYPDFAAAITAATSFPLAAAVAYFIVATPMNKFNEVRKVRLETPAEPEVIEADLLTEICNLLAEQNGKPKAELN